MVNSEPVLACILSERSEWKINIVFSILAFKRKIKHCNYVLGPTHNIKTNYNCIRQNDPYKHAHRAFCLNARNTWYI